MVANAEIGFAFRSGPGDPEVDATGEAVLTADAWNRGEVVDQSIDRHHEIADPSPPESLRCPDDVEDDVEVEERADQKARESHGGFRIVAGIPWQ